MIEVTNTSKKYSDEAAIGPVDLVIPEGGITALVGPNGAGKSTLLTMIGRLLDMDEGSIQVAGMDVTTTKSKDLARVLAILRQENHILTRLTVRQLVEFGRFPHSRGRLTRVDQEQVDRAIAFMNLGDLQGRFLDELSGGQRQRAHVAMVLAQDTDYLLLDEPLNNLDVAHSHGMLRTLRRAADELGKTIVIVVHDINYASCWADQIVAMKDGRIHAIGAPHDIMRRDLLREVFDLDIEVSEFGGHQVAHFYLPVPVCTSCRSSTCTGCALEGDRTTEAAPTLIPLDQLRVRAS